MDKLKLKEAIMSSDCKEEAHKEMPFSVGEKVFIRTVTHYLMGRIKAVVGGFLVLSDAAWIADTGRFMNAMERGELREVEPVTCDVRVNTEAIIDVYEWRFDLPRDQK